MEAIRDAARRLGTRDLSGSVLVSSSRPCRMCEAAPGWARIELAHKADPNLVDREGATPLAHALQRGQRDIAQLLRAAGARTTR